MRCNQHPLPSPRAEDYRRVIEESDLMFKATPIEKRQGGNVWQMSLRDCWTRYIGVGNMFSGLEIPFEDRPELQPEKIESIGRPLRDAAPGKRKPLVDSLLDSAFMRERRAAAQVKGKGKGCWGCSVCVGQFWCEFVTVCA
jgi:hypothetical protein